MKRKKNYLGDKIYDWRKQNEISQEDFADMVGVSRQSIQKWEAGLAAPKSDKLQQICEIIGVGLDELISDSTEVQPSADVVEDEVAEESETVEKSNIKKSKLSLKAKIIIAATVILLVLLVGIALIVFDKFSLSNVPEGAMSIAKSDTWNFSRENIGWIVFGVAMAGGIILGIVLICKTIKTKKKSNDDTQNVAS